MKAWLVYVTFKDGGREGVVFTDKDDAEAAFSGCADEGSTLAVEWCDLYGCDNDLSVSMREIEL